MLPPASEPAGTDPIARSTTMPPSAWASRAGGGSPVYSQSFFLKKKKMLIPISAIRPSTA